MPRARHSVSTRAKKNVLLKRRLVLDGGAQIYFKPLKISAVSLLSGLSIKSLPLQIQLFVP